MSAEVDFRTDKGAKSVHLAAPILLLLRLHHSVQCLLYRLLLELICTRMTSHQGRIETVLLLARETFSDTPVGTPTWLLKCSPI